ncbi:MAG TPA: hypothetical protein VFV50_07595 [Bdellovibrionales bacterium]|nr:hypothetical protein [Bdellovibrionales bacterium]
MKHVFSILTALSLAGCGSPKLSQEAPLNEEMRVSDVIKLISSDIKEGADDTTFDQQHYRVGPSRRLLIMYSSLNSHVGTINTANGGKVTLELSLTIPADTDSALNAFKICPITDKWMLLATWERAFPRRKWNTPGGDFDLAGCVSPTSTKPAVSSASQNQSTQPQATAAPAADPDGSLYFDITKWYLNYPKGRGVNYGLILVSTAELEIMGDRSGGRSPRIYWYEREGAQDQNNRYYQFGRK